MSAKVIQLADCKLSASTSFSADEVALLDTVLAVLRRGGSMPPSVGKSGAVAGRRLAVNKARRGM